MPDEVMVNIFQRLPTVEVLKSTRKLCTTWGRINKYPAMWKVINMHKRPVDGIYWACGLEALTKEAVDLSCGELINIRIQGFCTDKLLDHIVLHSNKLKRLCLVSCFKITNSVLSLAVKKLPQLEELHLLGTCISAQDLEVIGRNFPQLKSFRLIKGLLKSNDVHAFAIANNMPELRHLKLFDGDMTNDGLKAILNGCPHLQSLDFSWCTNPNLDRILEKLCVEQIKDLKYSLTQKRRVL